MGGRYIEKFFSLKCAPDVLSVVGHVQNAEKEITESMGVLRHVQRIVLRDVKQRFLLLDLCAGNALTSVLAVHLFPNVHAIALDKLPRERNWDRAQRFQYVTRDLYGGVGALLDDYPTIVLGVHACGDLATQIIKYYRNYAAIRHMILLPCCSGTLAPMPALIHEKFDRYEQWAYSLYLEASKWEGAYNLMRDRHIQSPKNIILTGSKTGG